VSILIAAGAGAGRCFGSLPRANVSMMNMRPPQQGHGRGSMLVTLCDAAEYVMELPEAERGLPHWVTATVWLMWLANMAVISWCRVSR
jgi:hypothetical protein